MKKNFEKISSEKFDSLKEAEIKNLNQIVGGAIDTDWKGGVADISTTNPPTVADTAPTVPGQKGS